MTRTTSLPQPAISPKVQRRRPKWDRAAIIMIAPYLIFLVVFTAYPIFMAVYGSLSDWNILTGEMTFRGFQYYEKLLRDPVFFASLKNTLVYLMVQVPGSIIIGIFVAVLLNQRIRFRGVFRTIFFLPVVMPVVVLAIVWQWMYQERGVLNYLLSTTGMPSVSWLTSSDWSMLSIAIMKIWTDIGFYSVLFLAGLQTIPSEFTDAARVDGAGAWQIFWKVKLPLLNPTIVFAIMMGTIWGMQLFVEPFLLTGGGPLDSSQTLILYLYEEGFVYSRLGYASAIGVVTAVLILVITLIQRRIVERTVSL
jgi:multiple sugar transport system permease protein